MRAVPGDPFTHGPVERLLGPLADPGIRVGRDIGGIQGAELGLEGKTARVGLIGVGGVTALAVADARHDLAPVNLLLREAIRRGRRLALDTALPREQ